MTVQEALQNILHAVLGKDVRQSIHDGIDTINKESKADMEAKQAVIDIYTGKQDLLDKKYDNLLEEMSQANPSVAEVVDARLAGDSTQYAYLKDRLDAIYRGTEIDLDSYNSISEYIVEHLNDLNEADGILENLKTVDKSSLVAAINTLVIRCTELQSTISDVNTALQNKTSDTGWKPIIGTNACGIYTKKPEIGTSIMYRKKNGIVHVYGNYGIDRTYAGGSSAKNTNVKICTLPAGFRPKYDIYHINSATGATVGRYLFGFDGTVKLEWLRKMVDATAIKGSVSWAAIAFSFPED